MFISIFCLMTSFWWRYWFSRVIDVMAGSFAGMNFFGNTVLRYNHCSQTVGPTFAGLHHITNLEQSVVGEITQVSNTLTINESFSAITLLSTLTHSLHVSLHHWII